MGPTACNQSTRGKLESLAVVVIVSVIVIVMGHAGGPWTLGQPLMKNFP